MRLTKRAIDAITPDAYCDLFFWDDLLPDFGLRVKPSGAKSFLVQYRNAHGLNRRLTLGRYGVLTPDQARTAAKLPLADVARGGDPIEAKAARRGAMPVAEGEKREGNHAPWQDEENKHSYAVTQGYRPDNPVTGVVRPVDNKRKYRLGAEGYKPLDQCLIEAEKKGEPWQTIAEIRAFALTGCRRGGIENLKHVEVDQRGGALRLGDSKTGESVQPTGAAAFEVFRDAFSKGNSEYVFPSPGVPKKRYGGLPKVFKRIVGNKIPGLTPQKLRHAYGSAAEDLGLTVPTIGALLGHAGHGVSQAYIYKVDHVLIDAADRVASYISRAMMGRASNVVTLKKRTA